MSENFIFLITAVPILLLLVVMLQGIGEPSLGTLCLNPLVIFIVIMVCMRNAKRWFQIINRPAFNLLRAMNFEAATGYTVLDEDIRTSVLYMYIMQRKPTAWQERTLKIIDNGKSLPNNWRLRLPNFESHSVEGGEEVHDESPLEPYEEEGAPARRASPPFMMSAKHGKKRLQSS